MIARTWHGRVPRDKAAAYEVYLRATGLADYARVAGNRGVYLLRRDEGDVTHFTTLTFWDSVDAIRAFAGPDHERARYYPEDDAYLLEREPCVTHFEVVEASSPSDASRPAVAGRAIPTHDGPGSARGRDGA